MGIAARIRVLDLPKETKDISGWFAAGHSGCEMIAMLGGVPAFYLQTDANLGADATLMFGAPKSI